jgi:hypothetical protein
MKATGKEAVYAPKGDMMLSAGIAKVSVIGFKNKVYFIPKEAIGGAGMEVTTTKYFAEGKPMHEAIEEWVKDAGISTEDLKQRLDELFPRKEEYVLDLNSAKEFKVKSGWFSRGIYFKRADAKLRSACSVRDKEAIKDFMEFYGMMS